jgi:hypothetical protein
VNYLLRNIPLDLWRQVKHRAVDEGRPVRELILEALRRYVGKEKS